jgi:hypothetical protein
VAKSLNRFGRKALAVAERFADAEVSEEQLRLAWQDARRAETAVYQQARVTAESYAMATVALVCETDINRAVLAVGEAARCEADPVDPRRLADAHRKQVPLVTDIFGNPFRPVTFSPAWRTDTALSLAAQMYEAREFSAMPILADALQDAGCDSAEILDHCRGPGPHVRGCWVVDRVLGRE